MILMNSRAMDGSRDHAAARRNFKKKRCIGSVWLASLILLACRASADEDGVTRALAVTGTASIGVDDGVHTVASSSSYAENKQMSSEASQDLEARSTAELQWSAIESTTTKLDAEWSAESFESGEATSSTISSTTESAPRSTQSKSAVTSSPVKSPPWPWMVFVLSGNSTVAARRQRDLGTYLRLNLAARLDADYNDVTINRILLTGQSVLANISVEPSHLAAAGLDALGHGNVTLLELSGNEFQVERIIRFDGALDQREMMNLEMASMVATVGSEVTVYGAVGAVFLFLLVALLLGLSFNSPCRNDNGAKYLSGNNFDRDHMDAGGQELLELRSVATPGEQLASCAPPVIYSEQLAREMCDSASLLPRTHFIPTWSPGDAGAAPASPPAQLHRYQPTDRRHRAKQDQPDRHSLRC